MYCTLSLSLSPSQVAALDQLKTANPDGRFWLKLDATELKEALMESFSGDGMEMWIWVMGSWRS